MHKHCRCHILATTTHSAIVKIIITQSCHPLGYEISCSKFKFPKLILCGDAGGEGEDMIAFVSYLEKKRRANE